MALTCLAGAWLLTYFVEWDYYQKLLQWESGDLLVKHRTTLFHVLWAKTLVLYLPPLGLAGLLLWRRRVRGAWLTLLPCLAVITTWLVVDMRIHEMTGNRALTLLAMLWQSGGRDFWPSWTSVAAILRGLALVAAAAAALAAVAWGAVWLATRRRPAAALTAAVGLSACLLIPLNGLRAARWDLRARPLVLEMLEDALPVPVPFLRPVTEPPVLGAMRVQVGQPLEAFYRELYPQLHDPAGEDPLIPFAAEGKPNLLLVVFESLRADVFTAEVMPRLDRWSRQGLRLERHYAATNNSQCGLFALLYGRVPLFYERTLERGVPPQMLRTLRRAGYQASLIHTTDNRWMGMERFLNEREFDRVVALSDEDEMDRPSRDQAAMDQARSILTGPGRQPQLVVVLLVSTHHPYNPPKGFQGPFQPSARQEDIDGGVGPCMREVVFNRYRNACAHLDQVVGRTIESLDPARHLVVVTGDHAESFWDDGVLAHSTKLSEAQTRTPLALVGPGIQPGIVQAPTSHIDLLPTLLHALADAPVPLLHLHGRDLLADPEGDGQVLLVQTRLRQPREVLLIRGGQRMMVKVWTDRPQLQVKGCFDARGSFDPENNPPQDQWPDWVQAWKTALQQLTH